ncbi:MAG: flagellar protein FlgN [Planctomycetes bacterium]|nr:flagellar protein FlgN [Planctomycetota bacterium]
MTGDPKFARVRVTLERLTKLYDDLIEVSERKKGALTTLDLEEMRRCTTQEELLSENVRQADVSRRAAIAVLRQDPALRLADESLGGVISAAPEAMQGDLYLLRRGLTERAQRLARVNNLNRALCNQSLTLTNTFIDLYAGRKGVTPATYSARPQSAARHTRAFFDRKA